MSYIKPKSKIVVSAGEIGQLLFSEDACAQRSLLVGGSYTPIGVITSVTRVGSYATLMLANTDTAAHWVAFGLTTTITPPTGITNAIFLPPMSNTVLSSGKNVYIIADSNKVGLYEMRDTIVAQTHNPPLEA